MVVDERLPISDSFMNSLRSNLKEWRSDMRKLVLPGVTIDIIEVPYKPSETLDRGERMRAIASASSVDSDPSTRHIYWADGIDLSEPTVIWIGRLEGKRPVAQQLGESLAKDAKRQFSGCLPALLAVEFESHSFQQMLDIVNIKLADSNRDVFFDQVCKFLFRGSMLNHVIGIVCFPGRIHGLADEALNQLSEDYMTGYSGGYFAPNPNYDGSTSFDSIRFARIPTPFGAPTWRSNARLFVVRRQRLGIAVPFQGSQHWR